MAPSIIPTDDSREHIDSLDCWCGPTVLHQASGQTAVTLPDAGPSVAQLLRTRHDERSQPGRRELDDAIRADQDPNFSSVVITTTPDDVTDVASRPEAIEAEVQRRAQQARRRQEDQPTITVTLEDIRDPDPGGRTGHG